MSESFDIPQTHQPFHIEISDGDYFIKDSRGTLMAEVHGVARKQRAEYFVKAANQLSLYRGLLERALGHVQSHEVCLEEDQAGFRAVELARSLAKEIKEALG